MLQFSIPILPQIIAFMNDEPLSFLFLFTNPVSIDTSFAISLKNLLRLFDRQVILFIVSSLTKSISERTYILLFYLLHIFFLNLTRMVYLTLPLGVKSSNEPALVRKVFPFLPFLRLFSSLSANK